MMAKGGRAAIQRALSYYKAADYEAAVVELAEAEVDEDDFIDLAYVLGLCYVRLKKFDEALLYLEQVVTGGADEARVEQCRLSLAYIYSLTGRSSLAEYELKKLLEIGKDSVQAYATLGYSSWAQGRLEEALDWYGKALARDPENLNALNGYGYLLACADRDLARAVSYCRRALDGKPDNPAYADSLGWAYLRMGLIDEAGRYLRQAAERLAAHKEVAYHLRELGKAQRA